MIDLKDVVLDSWAHDKPEDGGCLMEWVSVFAGEPWSDRPSCTDPVVAEYARTLNDQMPYDQRQRLVEFIPLLAGTKNGVSQETRAFMCADRAVRVFAPIALGAAGKAEEAAKLRELPSIVDRETAERGWEAYAEAVALAGAGAGDAEAVAYAAYVAWREAEAWDEAIQLLRDLCEVRPSSVGDSG